METMAELAEAVRKRSGRRYDESLKTRVMRFVLQERMSGRSWSSLVEGLGISSQTLQNWSRTDGPNTSKLLRVRTMPTVGTVSLVSPSGWKIEGLTLPQALRLMSELST